MILLLGGTGESAAVAEGIAEAGYDVLVSAATDVPLNSGSHANLHRRSGRLNAEGMLELVRGQRIRAIVDVTHPYASEVRATAAHVAERMHIPYLTYVRPKSTCQGNGVRSVSTHEEAAQVAFAAGKPVLLTIGSKHVAPYVNEARRKNVLLAARVLDHADSVQACVAAGLPEDCIVTGRGPFTLEQNRVLLRQFEIAVMVTKDSGDRGGVREKLEAARLEGCEVVVVERPELPTTRACATLPDLISGLRLALAAFPVVAAFDLESVLVPEIWPTVAQVTGVQQLALTTRDIADYNLLMDQRIKLCRENGLSLAQLRKIVGAMQPLPGAVEFLAWVQARMLAVIVSDTYHELAGPVVEKLGCSLMVCNALTVDEQGYISGHRPHHVLGKAEAVQHFRGLGFQVLAVGDSYNDVEMLQTADVGILLSPCSGLVERAQGLPIVWNLEDLKAELNKWLRQMR
jgi:precorrin-6A/cobalt-precorrin-6A reductase